MKELFKEAEGMDRDLGSGIVKDRHIGIAFFLLVFLAKLPLVSTPFHWDDLGEGCAVYLNHH